jgi:hypothetical protein
VQNSALEEEPAAQGYKGRYAEQEMSRRVLIRFDVISDTVSLLSPDVFIAPWDVHLAFIYGVASGGTRC